MKKYIFRAFALCLPILATSALTGCDDSESKSEIDSKFAVTSRTSVTCGNVNVVAFNQVDVDIALSKPECVVEVGVQYSQSEDFAASKYCKSLSPNAALTLSVTDVTSNTKYFARPYAYLIDGSTVLGSTFEFTTPDVPFDATWLEGKTYKASKVADYWTYTWDFNVTVKVDASDATKVWIYGLCPYAEYYFYNNYVSAVYGTIDTESMTITIPSYQSLSPDGLSWFCFSGVDSNWAYLSTCVIDIVDNGKKLVVKNGFCTYDTTDYYWYDCNFENLTLTSE